MKVHTFPNGVVAAAWQISGDTLFGHDVKDDCHCLPWVITKEDGVHIVHVAQEIST